MMVAENLLGNGSLTRLKIIVHIGDDLVVKEFCFVSKFSFLLSCHLDS